MNEKDGGPAFPRSDAGWSKTHDGMSLRDYLAGQAVVALMSSERWVQGLDAANAPGEFKLGLAGHAYLLADAMLEARK